MTLLVHVCAQTSLSVYVCGRLFTALLVSPCVCTCVRAHHLSQNLCARAMYHTLSGASNLGCVPSAQS